MPTERIEVIGEIDQRIPIGNIGDRELYVLFTRAPTSPRPRRISRFKIACTGNTRFNDSEAVILESSDDASRIASDIADALKNIVENRLPHVNTPVLGHPEIRVEQLTNQDVRIANGEKKITIPRDLIFRLCQVLKNVGEPDRQ